MYPAYTPPDRIIAVRLNESAMLSVDYCSNPDPDWDVMFTFPNGTQGDPAGVDWIPDGARYTIEIAVVQEQHYGNYTFSPHNQYGQPPEPAVFMLQTRGT